MIESSRPSLTTTGYPRLEDSALRFPFIHYRIVFALALLAFSTAEISAASKDPTLRGAGAARRTVHSSGSRRLGSSKGGHSLSAGSQTKAVNLDSQLKQLEKQTSRATTGKPVEAKLSKRAAPTPATTSRADKIDFRQNPRSKSGMSNQQGEGSGSRRYGPGRRVTEKSP
jgi:hypothetical protein